jgi:CubicO group peptidase (beta-lactamase class C family)
MSYMSANRLAHLRATVEQHVESGLYYGAAVRLARHGETVLDIAIGHADADGTRPLVTDSVFSVFSMTKTFVNVLVLRAVELGRFALTTKVAELVPAFSGPPRERATIFHLLTHTAGLPSVWEASPGAYADRHDENVAAVCERVHGIVEPGARCDYAPMANHVLLAEALRVTDPAGRAVPAILEEDLFAPLGMTDTAMGIRPHMRERHVVPDMRGTVPIDSRHRGLPDVEDSLYRAEYNEAAWVGAASTTGDMHKVAEMLRGEGAIDGTRILSPRTVQVARRNWTGTMENELYATVARRAGWEVPPAYIGLGFNVRGARLVHHQFGTLTSPDTMGNYGAGSCVYWVDPELDMTFVGLTAGLLSQAPNIQRFQQLSDVAVSAAV